MYTLIAEAMAEAGLLKVDTYCYINQNTVAQHIATSHIIDLCLAA